MKWKHIQYEVFKTNGFKMNTYMNFYHLNNPIQKELKGVWPC